jgi:hypothetical protein
MHCFITCYVVVHGLDQWLRGAASHVGLQWVVEYISDGVIPHYADVSNPRLNFD